MNSFWIFTICIASLVASTTSEYVVCNAGHALRFIGTSRDLVSCNSAQKGGDMIQYSCPIGKCTRAVAQGCTINDHAWQPTVQFTCDQEYTNFVGNGNQIDCVVDIDYGKKCGSSSSSSDCDNVVDETHDASCTKIVVHAHCNGCSLRS